MNLNGGISMDFPCGFTLKLSVFRQEQVEGEMRTAGEERGQGGQNSTNSFLKVAQHWVEESILEVFSPKIWRSC